VGPVRRLEVPHNIESDVESKNCQRQLNKSTIPSARPTPQTVKRPTPPFRVSSRCLVRQPCLVEHADELVLVVPRDLRDGVLEVVGNTLHGCLVLLVQRNKHTAHQTRGAGVVRPELRQQCHRNWCLEEAATKGPACHMWATPLAIGHSAVNGTLAVGPVVSTLWSISGRKVA